MRVYPYTTYKHNLMEALGHCALMLTYAISLILRNDNEEQWAEEWWPRAGYGECNTSPRAITRIAQRELNSRSSH